MVSTALTAHSGPFTVADLAELPDDGLRYELVDGSLLVSPAPLPIHQYVAFRLVAMLNQQLPDGYVAVEAVGMRFADDRLFIPDVVVAPEFSFAPGQDAVKPADACAAIEIMSKSSRRADRILKPSVYAEAGIPAYVRIELADSDPPLVIAHELVGGIYRETARSDELILLHTSVHELTIVSAKLLPRASFHAGDGGLGGSHLPGKFGS